MTQVIYFLTVETERITLLLDDEYGEGEAEGKRRSGGGKASPADDLAAKGD